MGAQSVGRVERGRMGAPRDPRRMAGCGMGAGGAGCMGGQQDECWGILGDTEGARVGAGGCRRTHRDAEWVVGDEWGGQRGCRMGAGGCRSTRGAGWGTAGWKGVQGSTGAAGGCGVEVQGGGRGVQSGDGGLHSGTQRSEGGLQSSWGCESSGCVGGDEGSRECRGEGRHSRDVGVQEGCRGIVGCRRDAGWRGWGVQEGHMG